MPYIQGRKSAHLAHTTSMFRPGIITANTEITPGSGVG